MSTLLRPRSVAAVPVRRLDLVELRKRLAAVEERHAIVGVLLSRWKPHGSNARQNYRALRQERSALGKRIKVVRRAIAAAGGITS